MAGGGGNGDGGQGPNWPEVGYFYYDDYFNVDYWWSGTPGCETTLGGLDDTLADGAINKGEDIVGGGNVLVTAGSELGCHRSSSQHYCSTAIDIWVGGWSTEQVDELRDWADQQGYSNLGPGDPGHDHHVHIGFGSPCTVQ